MSELLTPDEVADRLRVSIDTVRRYIRNGDMPAIKIGGQFRIEENELDCFILRQKINYSQGGNPNHD
jgi:excisionase family DNA binding protein